MSDYWWEQRLADAIFAEEQQGTRPVTSHRFTEDVDDYSMCVCGVPADSHHLIEETT